jgi:PAS domain-containing protein
MIFRSIILINYQFLNVSKTVFDSLPNLHSVTYVDCLTPTYLSDAVISTDMLGQIVTINDAALELLGCPVRQANNRNNKLVWEQNLIGRQVWDVIPIENLQMRLEDSLQHGAKHYVPEQSLMVGLYNPEYQKTK